MPDTTLKLNFLALENQDFDFPAYCRLVAHNNERKESNPDIYRLTLPEKKNNPDADRRLYDVTLNRSIFESGYEEKSLYCHDNRLATEHYLLTSLFQKCKEHDVKLIESEKKIKIRKLMVILSEDNDGKEYLSIRPCFIPTLRKYGYTFNFGFRCNPGVNRYQKSVLIKSLVYNKNGKYNADMHVENYRKIGHGIMNNKSIFDGKINIDSAKFEQIAYDVLPAKKIIVANGQESNSQFGGVAKHGPYLPVSGPHKFYFVYEESNKFLAHKLYFGLTGQYSQFSGVEKFFGLKMIKGENYVGLPIRSYDYGLSEVIDKIKNENVENKIAMLILNEKENDNYFRIKESFLSAGVPVQFVVADTLKNESMIKWSVSNLALQSFSKIGGVPWKVKTKNSNCLIIGVSQSYDRDNMGKINKYYGYSVMTDSSGIYKEVKFLYSSENESEYLNGLMAELKKIMLNKRNEYNKFVLHLTFRIKKKEIENIALAVKGAKVVAINIDRNSDIKIFSASNSKVPESGTYIKLSKDVYVLCTDGIKIEDSAKIKKPWPHKISFIYKNIEDEEFNPRLYIQDIYNLSSANWRGFNSHHTPTSLLYAACVARYLKGIHKNNVGQAMHVIDSNLPWFL